LRRAIHYLSEGKIHRRPVVPANAPVVRGLKRGYHSSSQFYFNFMKGATMKARIAFGFFFMMFVLALPASAGVKGELQKYFNNTATKVKATDNPSEKRAILNESFQTMSKALDMVQRSPSISKNDDAGINRVKALLQEKQHELAGTNGYVRVSDAQLNAFSNYVVQDMEQADQIISISLVALLLIILLIVLVI
jgi:hypothetical protein